ncbi:hypothetical protein SABR111722_20155 [Saccharibacillus brassicae]
MEEGNEENRVKRPRPTLLREIGVFERAAARLGKSFRSAASSAYSGTLTGRRCLT